MSRQAASEFLEKLTTDETLSEKLFSKGGSKQERLEAFVAAGRERGFTFGGHDVESVLASSRSSEEGALAEPDLEQVVGGRIGFIARTLGVWYSWLGAGGGGDGDGGSGGGIRG